MKKFFFYIGACFVLTALAAGLLYYVYSNRKPKNQPIVKAPETKITIIEGWSVKDIAQYLQDGKTNGDKPIVTADEFIKAAAAFDPASYPILADKPPKNGLEGYIFPDTYFIPKTAATGTTMSEIILKKALDNFSKKFTSEMAAQARKGNMSVFDVVILASIVERETGRNAVTEAQKQALDEERKIVAGIFYNRLNAGMALASDATINYVTKKNAPQASSEDLQIDSPYNTYKYPGLPPGPICNPSLSSLVAVLYPTKTDYLYFLHKQPSGEVVYSKTFEEHVRNKRLYLQ